MIEMFRLFNTEVTNNGITTRYETVVFLFEGGDRTRWGELCVELQRLRQLDQILLLDQELNRIKIRLNNDRVAMMLKLEYAG